MKVRNGFVSNSSSTSFSIYGVVLDESDVNKLVEETHDVSVVMDGTDEPIDQLMALLPKEFEYYHSYEQYYIGRGWSSIGDEETGKQFRSSIEDAFKKVGVTESPSSIEETIEN